MGVLRPILDWLEGQDWGWFNFVRDQLIGLVSWVDNIITPFFDRAEKFIDKLWELDLRIFGFIIDTLDRLKKGFDQIWDNLVYLAVDVIDRIRVLVDELYWSIYYAVKYTIPYLVDKVIRLSDRLEDLAEKAITDIGELWEDLKPKVKELVDGAIGVVEAGLEEVKALIENVTKNLQELSNNFTTFISSTWQTFTTQTTSVINALTKTVYDAIIPAINSIWETLGKIPTAVLDLLNQPEKMREEEEGIREASLTHMKGIIQGKTPTEIQPPEKLSTTLHSSPIGILELLFFYLIQVLGFNLFGLYRWISEFPGFQKDKDTLPDVREMSLEELMNSVDHLLGSLEDLIAGMAERIIVVHPDGSTGTITETEMTDPEVVAETPFGVPGLMYLLYTVRPHGFYIVLSPYVGGYKFIYDEEKNAWKVEWASAEECRRLMDKAGFKIISFGVS